LYVSTLKGALNRYPKIPFTNTFDIRFFVSVMYGVKYDEIWCEGVVFKRGNIARITYNKKKKNANEIVTVFKMSFTADEYCNSICI
jgi:hypothetical protein